MTQVARPCASRQCHGPWVAHRVTGAASLSGMRVRSQLTVRLLAAGPYASIGLNGVMEFQLVMSYSTY